MSAAGALLVILGEDGDPRIIGLDDMRNLLGWTHRESPEPELLTQAVRDHLAYVEERMAQLTRVKEHLLALERQAVPSAAREICEERPGCGGS